MRIDGVAPRVLTGLGVVLLLPALLITLDRLVEPPWARAVQLVAFTPLALPAYAGALVLLVSALVLGRHRPGRRVARAAAALLAVAGLVLHAVWFAPQVLGETPRPAAGAEQLTVMSANLLFGGADTAALVEEVREHEVGLLVTTELTDQALAALDAAGLDDLLPFRVGSAGPADSVMGTMVFAARPLEQVGAVATFSDGLVVEVPVGTEATLRVVAVHPAPPTLPDQWRADHAAILEAAERYRPDAIVGDLNATPDHAPLRALRDLGYRDAAELTNAGWAPTWPVGETFGVLGLLGPIAQIDHVLLAEAWTATGSATSVVGGTDHAVLRATIAAR